MYGVGTTNCVIFVSLTVFRWVIISFELSMKNPLKSKAVIVLSKAVQIKTDKWHVK